MVSAVVLLSTGLDAPDKVVDNLRSIKGVEEAHALYGVYDLFVKIRADSIDDLKNMTKKRIKKVAGVTSSLTLMVTDPPTHMP
ncbi:MAG: Lrp/AsnC ligand binding domain-containing protein [Methanocella sp.]|jgi:DNA-binding Lrp family transcriptional regulator